MSGVILRPRVGSLKMKSSIAVGEGLLSEWSHGFPSIHVLVDTHEYS